MQKPSQSAEHSPSASATGSGDPPAARTDKSTETVTLVGDLGALNMAAMMSITRIALGGMAALAQETIAGSRRSSEQAIDTLRALSGAKTASDLLSVQSAFLKGGGEALLDHAARTRQIAGKTAVALTEGCSTHAQDMVVRYTRIVRR